MGYEQYRTQAELDQEATDQTKVADALAEARTNLAFAYHAIDMTQDQATVDMWIDRTYSDLRGRLSKRRLLQAIISLIAQDAREAADRMSAGVGDDDVAEVCSVWAEQGYGDTP